MENVNLSKIFLFYLLLPFLIYSEDLKIADDFQEGDIVSAETFNQIFDTLEKISREVQDEDLLGAWECSSLEKSCDDEEAEEHGEEHEGSGCPVINVPSWTKKGFMYELKSAQLNLTASTAGTTISDSLNQPYNFATSSPSPLYVSNSSSAGTYSLYKERIFLKFSSGGPDVIESWNVNLISDSRFSLSSGGAGTRIPDYIICDRINSVPAPPSSPSALNAKTSINLNWVDSSSDETGFKVYRKQGSNEYSLVSTQTTTSYVDSDTSEGVTYSYYISSFNENGDSKKSKIVSATLDSINPFVVATLPVGGENYSGTTVTITFNEVIEIKCPTGQNFGITCGALPAIELVGTGGSGNTYYMGQPGEKGISISGAPFVDGANPNYSVTVSKDHIFDLNGNQMEEDFTFSFTDG